MVSKTIIYSKIKYLNPKTDLTFKRVFDRNGTIRVLAQSEKGRKVIDAIRNDVRLIEVCPDKIVTGMREMFHSVPMDPRRKQFFEDSNKLKPTEFFSKWFPITFKVRCNSAIRLACHKLGIYTYTKRVFMLFYTRKNERKK